MNQIDVLVAINKGLRKSNSKLCRKINSMLYQQRYYLKHRGKELKESQKAKLRRLDFTKAFDRIKKLSHMKFSAGGTGLRVVRLTQGDCWRLNNILKKARRVK